MEPDILFQLMLMDTTDVSRRGPWTMGCRFKPVSFHFTVSLPPKMGDAILTSLSLPPSGKPASTRPPSNLPASNQPSTSADWRRSSRRTPAAAEAPFIAPVIGLISNKDVPVMISAGKKKAKARAAEDGSKGSNRAKRKQPDDDDGVDGGEEEEEEEGAGTEADERPVGRGASKRGRRTTLKKTNGRRRRGGSRSLSEDGDLNPHPRGAPSKICGASPLPTDLSLRVAVATCLLNQPTVVFHRLDTAAFGAANTDANVERARSERRGVHDDGGEQGGSGNVCTKKNSTESLCSDGKE